MTVSRGRVRRGELCFEAGDALVEEAVVGAGGLQALFQGSVSGGEVAVALSEGAVLGDDPSAAPGSWSSRASRSWPSSSPMRARWARISACAALRACSAFSARCCQDASAWASRAAASCRRWPPDRATAAVTRSRAAGPAHRERWGHTRVGGVAGEVTGTLGARSWLMASATWRSFSSVRFLRPGWRRRSATRRGSIQLASPSCCAGWRRCEVGGAEGRFQSRWK